MRRIAALSTCALALLSVVSRAKAGGLEYNGPGARAEGRGGAFAARADDPTALQYNQARLADLEGDQLILSLNASAYNFCVTRAGTYADNIMSADTSRFGAGTDSWANAAYPRTCNATPFEPGATLAFTHHIGDDLTVAIGVLTPTAAGTLRFGATDGTVQNGTLPNPLRYNLSSQAHLLFSPTLGAGYKLTPWLRLGAAFMWGMARIDNTNYVAPTADENPAADLRAHYVGWDYFVPGVIASADVTVMRGLNMMVGFKWSDAIHAKGSLDVTSGDFAPTADRAASTATSHVTNVGLVVPQAWWLTYGVRYGMNRSANEPDPAHHANAMADEIFDIEFDAVYEHNAPVTNFNLSIPAGSTAMVPAGGGNFLMSPLPANSVLPHFWNDQVNLRLGGDVNVIPDFLAVRAGVSYETNGVNKAFTQLDFFNTERVGLHAGATLRLMSKLDLSIAYAHMFYTTVVTPTADARYPQISAVAGPSPIYVNAGRYEASLDIFSLSANYKF